MTATFAERSKLLREMTGNGERVTASVVFDQVYAHYQHEHLEFHHPRGGQAKYLETPLYDGYREYLGWYADEVLHDGGTRAMQRAAEDLSDQAEGKAPREFLDLMHSGHPSVTVGERTVYDRAPLVHRLTEGELRAKGRARIAALIAAGLPWFFTRDGKVIRVPGKG